MEQRKEKRYRLSAPASFSWKDSEGIPQKGEGITRDISAKGIVVLSKSAPQPGEHVELDVYFPSPNGWPRTVQLHGEGEVTRNLDSSSSETCFAAEIIFETDNDTDNSASEILVRSGRWVQ